MDAALDQILRLLATTGVGIAVGFNRELRDKPLGMRMLALVSRGSAVAALAAWTLVLNGLIFALVILFGLGWLDRWLLSK